MKKRLKKHLVSQGQWDGYKIRIKVKRTGDNVESWATDWNEINGYPVKSNAR